MSKEKLISEFGPSNVIGREIMMTLIGPMIGEGHSRKVFEHAFREDLVIKIEANSKSFENIREYDFWQASYGTKYRKYLAPIEEISSCGIVLIQKKTSPVLMREMPELIPNIFQDLKVDNWGRYKKRIVCHDYAMNKSLNKSLKGKLKMRKANWW